MLKRINEWVNECMNECINELRKFCLVVHLQCWLVFYILTKVLFLLSEFQFFFVFCLHFFHFLCFSFVAIPFLHSPHIYHRLMFVKFRWTTRNHVDYDAVAGNGDDVVGVEIRCDSMSWGWLELFFFLEFAIV